jgi:hypothetical protein
VGVEVLCDDYLIWTMFIAVMALAAYQRLWLMRHVPPPPRPQQQQLPADGLSAPPPAAVSTRPRRHAALGLKLRLFEVTFWLFIVCTLLSMAWFPCVCAPPFYRMALHGTLAASAVYTGLCACALVGIDVNHSASMLAGTLCLMVTAAYASCVAAGTASADVVVGAVGMAVFYWAIVLR